MKKLLASLAALFISFSPAYAVEDNSIGDTCRFAQSLHLGNAATEAIVLELAGRWKEADRAKLVPVVVTPLKSYKLEKATVYLVTDFNPLFKEYLVVSGDKSSGVPIFFRITYSRLGEKYFFKHINLNSSFTKIIANGFGQEPKKIEC